MERVEGRSLAARHRRRRPRPAAVCLRLAAEIAEGLADAHAHGLIHRDLKPENVLVTTAGHAKIVDFGLARMLWNEGDDDGSGPVRPGLTEAGMLVGTVHAMSPEQASGLPVDHRSDLFAFGSLLYELFGGRPPFRGENWLDTLRRINGETPLPLARLKPGLPPALLELVDRLLSKDRDARPANARLVAGTLERIGHAAPAPKDEDPSPRPPLRSGAGSRGRRSRLRPTWRPASGLRASRRRAAKRSCGPCCGSKRLRTAKARARGRIR